ncbi:acetyltransferase, GNAT family [Paenibacillus algicola]|uniref:Acetyltransferase, GNAT family n=1 Tax=Paenibacillus algicola TaxID=2565926 RepID=A0A4P8XK04_9BACL|nr:GNAT family N-acetyltransferase [Paenibacillus algicola]QCT03002.1 acetyltransferase, GNAT family [Paenibacillus algicola]
MGVKYQVVEACPVEEVIDVFRSSGIRRPINDSERIATMIKNSDVMVTARENQQLIGFLRAITDYSYCCYISDLAVSKSSQEKGVGKQLIETLKKHLGEVDVQYILLSAPSALGFYGKIGFERADKAFVIRRKSN